ncbi:DNA sulfur modification protein DndB [Alkalihalophilus pseudofirmus]|uniref:DNA sulfur modification protein DndB n=1 Tax=Alkalihalophilus pseudofirmus TaxID=79885 RepID=A0AAJ2U3A0_ALKPS|nr:DNA sulfur modification protein DndB [Alkalihalophilus pseudofirmus]MDV2886365.1 DNA sulfur modification protein DndB [Alkalihalophilus pseudofirmus]
MNEYLTLVSTVYAQGDRIVYNLSMPFDTVANYLQPTEAREELEEQEDGEISVDYLSDIENRFRKKEHVQAIKEYILKNKHNFILPNVTLLSERSFKIEPIRPIWSELNNICGEEISEVQLQDSLLSILEKVGGSICVELKIPKDYFEKTNHTKAIITVGDGNHRVQAIKELMEEGHIDLAHMNIGLSIFVERYEVERKKIFVLLNSSLPVQPSVKSFLMVDDPLSNAVKELVGFENTRFLIKQLNGRDKKKYIGFEPIDNISKNSKNLLSFNILKNMVGFMAVNSTNYNIFAKKMSENGEVYRKTLHECRMYFEAVFDTVLPYKLVQGNLEKAPELKKEYISLSGAGLYLIAQVAYQSKQRGYDLQKVVKLLSYLDWKRVNNGKPNPFFVGSVLNDKGTVSNTRTALKAGVEKIMEYVDREMEKGGY